jgi:riboflavin kinase/FMN adenylyltransferase
LDEIPAGFGPSVVVIGNFDGVHRGHVHVLRTAAAEANGRHVVAITFDPHPMAVLRPEHAPSMLTSVEDRAGLLAAAGADAVFALPFSREVAAWTPDEFIDRVLVTGLGAAVVVVGANFRFGARASGDVESLRSHGGFEVVAVPLEGGPQVWSSTYIRQCLAAGDVEGAAEALGRDYAVSGLVVKGDQRGRELGYPTANVPVGSDDMVAIPADGVYAGWLTRADTGERFPAAISVGTNPTFAGQRERRVEAYALDRDDLELYGVRVEIAFRARIRGMVTFDGVEALIETMRGDVERTRELLA